MELREAVKELEDVMYDLEAFYNILQSIDEYSDMTLQVELKANVHAFVLMLQSIQNEFQKKIDNINRLLEEKLT